MRVQPFLGSFLVLLLAVSASAVAMDWTPVGDPGNACDPQPLVAGGTGCFGAVGYSYSIGTYEVTNAQYTEFLNAKAASDPLGLYNTGIRLCVRRHHPQRQFGKLRVQRDRGPRRTCP